MQNEEYTIEQIISRLKIPALNPMQEAALERMTTGSDLLLLSPTGTGKTLAFLLPLTRLMDAAMSATQALVIVPSRELALQIEQVFRKMGTPFKVTCCYGGHLRETEENNLIEAPALIIGTPGRLADHLRRENISPDNISTLVLDEFDKSLELGFQEEMAYIISRLVTLKKRVLTSATSLDTIPDFVGLSEPVRLEFSGEAENTALAIQQVRCDDKDKLNTLFRLLCYLGNRPSIIFSNHRETVERISNFLHEKGIINVFYHGAMEQRDRDTALCKFRNGSANFLVTTDLASRGLDIPHIRYIIHYHLPLTEEAFTHRNGRTARMDASGTAILMLAPDEALPPFAGVSEEIELPGTAVLPDKPSWATLFIAAGKKNKVNKVDVVGFLSKRGHLKKEDIGLIEVKDFFSFVAVRKSRISEALPLLQAQKIKNQKVKIEIAR